MAVTTDILRAWGQPRGLIREKLAAGLREDRALATVMGAGLLLFVAQWPRLAREAHLDPSVPLDARMGGALLALLFMLPLALYALAALSHLSPVSWAILGLEGAIWRDFSAREMVWPCAILLAVALVTFVIGMRRQEAD